MAHKLGIPSVLTLHGMYALNPKVLGGRSIPEKYFNKLIFSRVLAKTTVVVGGTEEITGHARNYGPINTQYCTMPTGGVNTDKFVTNMGNKKYYRSKYNLKQDSIVILFVGRMEPGKGVIEFSQAMNRIISDNKNDVEIVIVGDGSLKSATETLVTNSPRVHLIQWQSPDQIHEIYLASDIFVIPSRFEAFPLTVIEAMNAGLCIVYTPVGGMPEILSPYSPKFLLEEISVKQIYGVVSEAILEMNSTRDVRLLEYARKFSWKAISTKFNILLQTSYFAQVSRLCLSIVIVDYELILNIFGATFAGISDIYSNVLLLFGLACRKEHRGEIFLN